MTYPKTVKQAITLLCSIVLVMVLTACNTDSQDSSDRQITIFAAASLTDAFTEIASTFESHHDVTITLNFAGSSTLSTQIIEGASVDLFASANPLQITRLQQESLINEQPIQFASNQIILVVPTSNPAAIETLEDLAQPQQKLILAASRVPIREYTNILLDALSSESFFGAEFAESVYDNVVSEEDNVRQVLAKITLGEADAAFVYRTDITLEISKQVSIIAIPESVQPSIAYLIAPIKHSTNQQIADEFIQFLTSEQGQCILAQYQFVTTQTDC